ncbi:MAG: NAD(+) diphosphatase [Lysobacterales bacterium]
MNRLAERRDDVAWLADQYANPEARVMVVSEGRVLIAGKGPEADFVNLPVTDRESVIYSMMLGQLGSQLWFAVSMPRPQADQLAQRMNARFRGLRSIVGELQGPKAGIAGYVRGMDLWQANHRYCSRCGTPCVAEQAGFRLKCQNNQCLRQHFPRLDPAVIVAVGDQGRLLLGRQPGWPEGRYSTLAGFVEPGESLEDAVRREVAEESGVVVGPLAYHSSQPWPFPSSLMVGFIGEATETEICCDDELEDARWFDAEELRERVHSGELVLPFPASVSWHLIASFMRDHHQMDIRSWNNGDWQR